MVPDDHDRAFVQHVADGFALGSAGCLQGIFVFIGDIALDERGAFLLQLHGFLLVVGVTGLGTAKLQGDGRAALWRTIFFQRFQAFIERHARGQLVWFEQRDADEVVRRAWRGNGDQADHGIALASMPTAARSGTVSRMPFVVGGWRPA